MTLNSLPVVSSHKYSIMIYTKVDHDICKVESGFISTDVLHIYGIISRAIQFETFICLFMIHRAGAQTLHFDASSN